MKPTFRRRRDQGIALLLVLIAVVLIAALATEVSQTAATQHRVGKNAMNDFLLRTAVEGRVHILRASLRFDATGGQSIDSEDEDWSWYNRDTLSSWGERASDALTESNSDEAVTYTNTDVEVLAWCEDERSKLNLMGLSRPRDTSEYKFTRETLIRLIDEFREDWSNLDLTEADAQEMVEELSEWLEEQSDDDENPMPPVASGRGRLQSIADLLRVPGGKWTTAILYDVLDPDYDPEDDEYEQGEGEDEDFHRKNGIPGLERYLTVYAEPQANVPLRINVNTAAKVLMRALFDSRDAELADAIVENRREGAGGDDEDAAASGEEEDSGFFANKGQMTRVEGVADELTAYPRLDFFADTRSDIFSLRVVATMVTGTEDGEYDPDDPDAGPRDIEATYQYREVVQRTDQGFVTLYVERRFDPIHKQQAGLSNE